MKKHPKMEFTMKDFESVALHTATGDAVNVQQKKPFDIADVDNNEMKLEVIIIFTGRNKRNKHPFLHRVLSLFSLHRKNLCAKILK